MLYGAMLLDRGMSKDALTAFEATLKKEPHRLGANHRSGEGGRGDGRYRQGAAALFRGVALAETADPVRPEIAAARAFMAKAN